MTPLVSPGRDTAAAAEFRDELRDALAPWARHREAWERDGHLPAELFADLGALGIFRRRWETPPGGLDRVLAEESTAVALALGLALTLHSEVFIGTLRSVGRTARHAAAVEAALDGTVIGCFAVTEPTGGSMLQTLRTSAVHTGREWRVRGDKRFISNAGTATHALLLATDEEARSLVGHHSLFLVDLDAPGVTRLGYFGKAGTEECDLAALRLDAELPEDALVGSRGAGLIYANWGMQRERLMASAQVLAIAATALELAAAHARRRPVGGTRLIEHQVWAHRLADAQTALWGAEAFLESVMADEASGAHVAHRIAALKLACCRVAAHVVDEALQLLGGRGYTTNYPLERWWRDLRLARIGAGTDEIMRELVATAFTHPNAVMDEWVRELEAADLPRPDAPARSEAVPW